MRLIFILTLLFSFSVKAQNKLIDDDTNALSRFILNNININHDKIKDSTAIYTFSLKIEVTKHPDSQQVKITVNNPTILQALGNLNALKKHNYNTLLQNNDSAKILMRLYLIVLNSDYNPKLVDIYNIPIMLKSLLEKVDHTFIDAGIYGIMIDKKVYN